ncbi:MAG TPA: hypothetical protein VGX21_18850 [Methylomirabilota bacterium]|nr:hypothetical protein [Methylomirabilota bacterium]
MPYAATLVSLVTLTALLAAAGAATPAGPAVGAWATYQWTSSLREDVPVLVRQDSQGGRTTWSVARETMPPAPLFVTYAIVRADAKTYTMQITTHATPEGPPLSVTQVRVDRASGKALRSVIQRPKGVIDTPESGLRPFRQASVKGTEETAAVPAGRFPAVRAPYQDGTVWVSDQVPALGLVKATFPSGTLELVRSGTAGAKDLLRS